MKMNKLKPVLLLVISSLAVAGCWKKKGNSGSGSQSIFDRDPLPGAEGVKSYVYASAEEKTEILGVLEQYAVESKLTGLTLFNNGGYVMYHPSVTKGAASFIPGFGFGILSEGSLTADLEGENNAAWKRYYHTYETEDPGQVNAMNSKEATVSDVQAYMTASYFDTVMNETRDGYKWVASLANDNRPVAVGGLDENGLAKTFKFEVKVGSALKYNTNSTVFAAFNGREVALEDYITPYKILYTQAYGMERSGESLSGAGSIAGRSAYYKASAKGFDADEFAKVGIKAIEEGGKSYLQFTFNDACTPFYAMYYLASGMMAPVPASFIEALGGGDFAKGVDIWGAYNSTSTLTPKDTWLSTGAYTIEEWDIDQQIVLKRNPFYVDSSRYSIQGVHLNILAAVNTDPEAAFKEFLANKLHAAGIPSTRLDEYKNDPRATTTIGDSNFKLNLNTCDQATWETLFGVNGSVKQTAKADYWECEPAMANKDFVSGLSYALNRKEYASTLGRNPAFEYFSDVYLSDPENGVSYNSTQAHKNAVKSLTTGTDEYGYSKELASKAFVKAANQLIADGYYKKGDQIEIEIAWQTAAQEETYHNPLKKYIEEAFNVEENPLSLKLNFWVSNTWSDVYYKKMMVGQFDIGFGSISGNTYDPLSFMNVLSTDPGINQNFCLNWGIDTNHNDERAIQYDGASWSFDGLFKAATEGAYLVKGENSSLFDVTSATSKLEADGSAVVSGTFDGALVMEGENLLGYGTVAAMCIYGTSDGVNYSDYQEFYVYNTDLFDAASDLPSDTGCYLTVDDAKGTFEAHFSKTIVDYFRALGTAAVGFDLYAFTYIGGNQNLSFYATLFDSLPTA